MVVSGKCTFTNGQKIIRELIVSLEQMARVEM